MRPETRRVFDVLTEALPEVHRRGYELGYVMGIQAMEVDPEFALNLMFDYLGGEGTDKEESDGEVAMLWNAEQTIAALRAYWEAEHG